MICFLGAWRRHSSNIFEIAGKLVKVDHAAREIATVYSVTFVVSNIILSLIVVGLIDKTPPPRNG